MTAGRLALVCLLAFAVPVTALAQHAKDAAAAVPAPAPAKAGAAPAVPAAKAVVEKQDAHDQKAGAEPRGSTTGELEAALDRINEKLGSGVMSRESPHVAVISAPGSATPARARAKAAPVRPRIHLNWRTTVVWPDAFDDADAASRDVSSRLSLVWDE